jgi:hypothetical protein
VSGKHAVKEGNPEEGRQARRIKLPYDSYLAGTRLGGLGRYGWPDPYHDGGASGQRRQRNERTSATSPPEFLPADCLPYVSSDSVHFRHI